jgi:hypothetical protein
MLPGKTEEEEKDTLNNWVKNRFASAKLRFLHMDGIDPRALTESLGDNAMKANEYGLKNLKWILPQLPTWLNEKGENYKNLDDVYGEVINQYARYMGHSMAYIGGIYTDLKTTDQQGQVYTVVPKTLQKEAMAFLQKNLFTTPTWLLNKSILDRIDAPVTDRISSLQDTYLGGLLSTPRLQRLISSANRETGAYRLDEFMDDLRKGIYTELLTRQPIDNYRRNLQKSFVERLGALANPGSSAPTGGMIIISFGGPSVDVKKSDIMSVARGTLRTLKAEIAAAVPAYSDRMSRYHLQDLNERIERILNPR